MKRKYAAIRYINGMFLLFSLDTSYLARLELRAMITFRGGSLMLDIYGLSDVLMMQNVCLGGMYKPLT